MFVFKRAPRQSLSDLESFLREVGDQPVVWLEREVKSWGEFSYAELEDLILSGRAADLIDWQSRYAKVVNEKFNPLWLAAIARASYNSTRGKITIDDSDPRVKDFLQRRGSELIRDLSDESRRAIANVILHGQSEHLAPKEIARQIRPLIGLNQRQAQANVNYRQRVFNRLVEQGLSATVANQRADKAAIKYASKQHRQRAETIVHTELSRAYNQGAHDGVLAAQRAGLMSVCEMVWTTAGTNRVCGRCLSLKDTVVGRTNEVGVTLPPLHPRCRCTISYRELTSRPSSGNVQPNSSTISPLSAPPATSGNVGGENKPQTPNFDPQRFGGQKLPEGDYNLNIRRQVQNRHIEGTKEYQNYAAKLSEKNLIPSKLSSEVDAQDLVKEFHGKGIYTPNPKDNSPREAVDTGRIVGQYWNNKTALFVDTSWIMIVYSKKGTHVYPIRPPQED